LTLVEDLERAGFDNHHCERTDNCAKCGKLGQTWYSPSHRVWYCENCYYQELRILPREEQV
jgi:hypothetical protein